ncbi:zinc finger protein 606 isoform X2 [Ovis canadensis]|uniref:zinc finger protein 606 isoform X2 n=1 Tax=Ovis canadensis TaxID=37174 RepID=UPI0010100723
MAAINPWGSWGILMDQSWGMTTVDPWASWALCPQDSTWQVEETAEERRRAPGLPTAQAQAKKARKNLAVSQMPATELGLHPGCSKEPQKCWEPEAPGSKM